MTFGLPNDPGFGTGSEKITSLLSVGMPTSQLPDVLQSKSVALPAVHVVSADFAIPAIESNKVATAPKQAFDRIRPNALSQGAMEIGKEGGDVFMNEAQVAQILREQMSVPSTSQAGHRVGCTARLT